MEKTPEQTMNPTATNKKYSVQNKNEVILYRLDAIDQQLSEFKTLLIQTSLQEQRIHAIEIKTQEHEKDKETLLLVQKTVNDLVASKSKNSDKWWQILLMVLSPFASALIVWILSGGLK